MRKTLPLVRCLSLLLFVFFGNLLCSFAYAQADLPDAPSAAVIDDGSSSSQAQAAQPPPAHEDPQQKRIFGILPNFRSVSAGVTLPPQTVKDKFVTATQDSFDYSAFILAALVATEAYLVTDTPEFGKGWVGYGRYYWHTFVDQDSENYFVEFIIPSIMHEDTRYYALGKGSGGQRALYAISRLVVTRKDADGSATFNSSEIVGAAISSGISNFYYPRAERTVGNTLTKYGVNLGIDGASFVFREFYPDLYHWMFHKRIEPLTTP
jgi:hypothetical protein